MRGTEGEGTGGRNTSGDETDAEGKAGYAGGQTGENIVYLADKHSLGIVPRILSGISNLNIYKMRTALLLLCLLFSLNVLAQSDKKNSDSVYAYAEQMPEPGYDIGKYLVDHLQYPDSAYNANIQGRVIVKFIVKENGSISNARVEKGIGGGCDEEALSVIKAMPEWKAGMHNGSRVKVWKMMPITFTLEKKGPVLPDKKKPAERVVYTNIDQPPYPEYSLRSYFTDNFHCKEPFEEGIVRFVVNEDGSISDPFVVSGIDVGCRAEVYRVLKSMPHWKPGKQSGQPARVYSTIRVRFTPRTGNIQAERI